MHHHPKLLLVYKSFSNDPQISHVGLGISAKAASIILNEHKISARTQPVNNGYELEAYLKTLAPDDINHVVMYAPFIDVPWLSGLVKRWPQIHFTVTIHSNIAFLQSDAFALKVIRLGVELSKIAPNFTISSNSLRLHTFIKKVYGVHTPLLPNLYPLDNEQFIFSCPHKPLRFGLFGAIRHLKNMLSGVGASILVSQTHPVELHMSEGRIEGGDGIMRAVDELAQGHKHFRLIMEPWKGWDEFKRLVRTMDLLLQPSFSESFNNVTADGASQYIPSVVSPAIVWAPDYWKAESDNIEDIANTSIKVLNTPQAGIDGYIALQRHNRSGIRSWEEYLFKTRK